MGFWMSWSYWGLATNNLNFGVIMHSRGSAEYTHFAWMCSSFWSNWEKLSGLILLMLFSIRGFCEGLVNLERWALTYRDLDAQRTFWSKRQQMGSKLIFNPLGKIWDFTKVRDLGCLCLVKWLIKGNSEIKRWSLTFLNSNTRWIFESFLRNWLPTRGFRRLRNWLLPVSKKFGLEISSSKVVEIRVCKIWPYITQVMGEASGVI